MFKVYRHKKQILFSFSEKPLISRYVIAQDLPLANREDLQFSWRNREIRIHCLVPAQWIALVTDAGICFRKITAADQTEVRFIIQNELPLAILIGTSPEKVMYYPLSSNNL